MNKFIEWSSLKFKKQGGKEKMRCPACENERSDKSDKSLSVLHDEGLAKCHYCGALSFRDSNRPVENKTYKLPEQNWKNYTDLSDATTKYLEGRKIAQFAIKELGITEENYYQPKRKKEVPNLVFNYFEGETLVNKKYRDGAKNFTQSAGAKSIFYNINSIVGEKEAYIVEGEMDVLAMYTHGIRNVISVPNGANDNDDYWLNSEPYIKNIEKFIIAVDNDTKGNLLKENIAQRLGRYRCEYVEFKHKDANGDLVEGVLGESIAEVKRFPVSGTFTVSDLYGGILDLYENGLPDTIYPKNECFGNLKNIFSVMEGHLVTTTGIPSHGKSTFMEWYILNLVNDYNMKASFFSPEHHPMSLHQTTLMQKAIGRNFWKDINGVPRITKSDIERYRRWADEKIYLTSPDDGDGATWDWMLDKFKEQMYRYGINIFVIDAFNKVQLPKGNNKDEVDRVLTRLTAFAQVNNVIVFLIAHPTKMKKQEDGSYEECTLYDVSGSADFRNQTHDGNGIYRYWDTDESTGYTEFTNLKTKMNFQGEIGGKVQFDYDGIKNEYGKYETISGRYYARGTIRPDFDMTKSAEEKQGELDWLNNKDLIPQQIDENDIPF